jgi:hypothetical protein
MRRASFNDPIPGIGSGHDEPESCELQSGSRKKTTARWPPEWLIPIFSTRGASEGEAKTILTTAEQSLPCDGSIGEGITELG